MEQIRIAIVEDETPHAQLLEQHIVSWGRDRNVGDIPIRRFDNAAAFLFDWAEERYDMIFLDIQMPGINGMETARKIRETDRGVKLVLPPASRTTSRRAMRWRPFGICSSLSTGKRYGNAWTSSCRSLRPRCSCSFRRRRAW